MLPRDGVAELFVFPIEIFVGHHKEPIVAKLFVQPFDFGMKLLGNFFERCSCFHFYGYFPAISSPENDIWLVGFIHLHFFRKLPQILSYPIAQEPVAVAFFIRWLEQVSLASFAFKIPLLAFVVAMAQPVFYLFRTQSCFSVAALVFPDIYVNFLCQFVISTAERAINCVPLRWLMRMTGISGVRTKFK